MENYDGIISLLFATLELLLFVNALIFSEKNEANKVAITVIFFLFGYQFLEALICFFGFNNQTIIALAFIDITFLPPLGFLLAAKFFNEKEKIAKALFVPFYAIILFFVYNVFSGTDAFVNTDCTPFVAGYDYPFEKYYGIFYYLPILGTLYLLFKNRVKVEQNRKKPYAAFLWGYVLAFLPYFFVYPFIGKFSDYYESILCKEAFFLAIALTYFSISNKKNRP